LELYYHGAASLQSNTRIFAVVVNSISDFSFSYFKKAMQFQFINRDSLFGCRRAIDFSFLGYIGIKTNWSLIRLDYPYIAISKIRKKGTDVQAWNLAGPDSFGLVDIRIVIDIFLVNLVFTGILDEDKMFTGKYFQSLFNCSSFRGLRGEF
jgi:hypothetical protein